MNNSEPGVSLKSSDFKKLFYSNFLNIFGSSFSAGAVSVLLIQKLNFENSQVPLILGLSSIIAAVFAIPLSSYVEARKKRPILVKISLSRGIFLLLFAFLAWIGYLNLQIIILLLTISGLLGIIFGAAAGVHTRDLVREKEWHKANSKIDSLSWILPLVATPLGGIAISFIDPGFSLLINGISYIVSGFMIISINYTEPPPSVSQYNFKNKYRNIFRGWKIIFSNTSLKYFFLNAMLFGGCLSALSPLIALLVLKDLGLGPESLSLVIAIPAVAGFIGTKLSSNFSSYFGSKNLLLWGCAARSIWAPFIFISPHSFYGLAFIILCECGLMFFAGLFNPLFSTYRMKVVNRESLASVGASWPISASIIQPMFLFLGSFLLHITDIRTSILIIGIAMLLCIVLIPWGKLKNFDI